MAATAVGMSAPWPPYSAGTGSPRMPNLPHRWYPSRQNSPRCSRPSDVRIDQLLAAEPHRGVVPLLLLLGQPEVHDSDLLVCEFPEWKVKDPSRPRSVSRFSRQPSDPVSRPDGDFLPRTRVPRARAWPQVMPLQGNPGGQEPAQGLEVAAAGMLLETGRERADPAH